MTVTRRQLVAAVRYWRKVLGLQDTDITISIRNPGDGDDAECDAEPQYQRATIRFNLDQIELDELDELVVHELYHIPVEPLGRCALVQAGGDPFKERFVLDTEDALVTYLTKRTLAWFPRRAR